MEVLRQIFEKYGLSIQEAYVYLFHRDELSLRDGKHKYNDLKENAYACWYGGNTLYWLITGKDLEEDINNGEYLGFSNNTISFFSLLSDKEDHVFVTFSDKQRVMVFNTYGGHSEYYTATHSIKNTNSLFEKVKKGCVTSFSTFTGISKSLINYKTFKVNELEVINLPLDSLNFSEFIKRLETLEKSTKDFNDLSFHSNVYQIINMIRNNNVDY